MRSLLVLQLTLVVIAAILVGLGLSMTIRRAYQDVMLARQRRREAVLRPHLLVLISEDEPDLSLLDDLTKSELKVAESLAWQLLSKVRGASRDALVAWLDLRGAIERARVRTHRPGRVGKARAAEKLGAAGVSTTSPDVARLLRDRNEEVRIVAARALGKLGDVQVVPALLAALRGDRRIPTSIVSMALLHLGPGAVTGLTAGLGSRSAVVRSACIDLLGMHGAISAVRWLVVLVENDDTLDIRVRSATALGRIGVPQAIEPLRRSMSPNNPSVLRSAAATALGQIGGPDAVVALHLALGDEDQLVGMAAAEALTHLGDEGRHTLQIFVDAGSPVSVRARHWLDRSQVVASRRRANVGSN